MTGKRVTLRDVARAAGVSPMTVSNVINGKHHGMTAETRRNIELAIARLDYRPNLIARGLKKGRQFSIGVLIVDRSPRFLTDPWTTNLVAGVSNYLNERGYSVVLHGTVASRVANISMLRNVMVDGLVVLLSGPRQQREEVVALLRRLRQPVILFQGGVETQSDDVCIVRQDDYGGALRLAGGLLGSGVRRLVTLTSDWPWPALEERERGIRDAIDGSGLDVDHEVLRCPETGVAEIGAALSEYAGRKGLPDLVMACNDQMGIIAMQHLRQSGAAVPDDVMVTGFNAFEFWKYAAPLLTSVRSPAYELGGEGARLLLERLESGAFRQRQLVLPVELQPGQSTRPF